MKIHAISMINNPSSSVPLWILILSSFRILHFLACTRTRLDLMTLFTSLLGSFENFSQPAAAWLSHFQMCLPACLPSYDFFMSTLLLPSSTLFLPELMWRDEYIIELYKVLLWHSGSLVEGKTFIVERVMIGDTRSCSRFFKVWIWKKIKKKLLWWLYKIRTWS